MQGYDYAENRRALDQDLWTKIIHDDKDALGELFDVYSAELLKYGYGIAKDKDVVGDAVQDIFVDIWSYRKNLAVQVQVKFYLYRSMRRAVIKHITQKQISHIDVSDIAYSPDFEPSPESEWLSRESETDRNSRILHSLIFLSGREREIISLKYYSDLKIREIASLLDIKEQTVANTLQNALTKLRKHLVYTGIVLFLFINFKINIQFFW
ncbi:RNA polymerase sigma factor [Dyadobacter sandarakinus]|uniref:Sigma-70 family RNA polymerase sigma factor n=1 Tax=Dyadobacter sandarakinus TaxID=2747268 RepID=A0ABX7I3D3_9BACT|nr:sigma-70 family RNA polymerase sigma factor [Dyadobacter sandarakinus]QRR00027.1 sigma-70 family RNA polymerase sigma factor [Dyadobacter sandarakinus]